MKIGTGYKLALLGLLVCMASLATAQHWTPLKNPPPFSSPGTALLLTDGTVIVHDSSAIDWWKLTPDLNANYVNGTWKQIASLPSNYGPLYYASVVLADGRVIVEGGEYNFGGGSFTNLGAIYDPLANKWTVLNPPPGWSQIGDASGIVFPDGTFMVADISTGRTAELNPKTLVWTTLNGTGKADRNDEEGWELLPDGTILTVDAIDAPNSEKFSISSGTWSSAGSTIVRLEDPGSQELGPAVLRPNGTVFATGANASGAGHTSIYSLSTQSWTAGPDIPNGLDIADGPAALLPNGNVLIQASPTIFHPPSSFFEFDGTKFISVPGTATAGSVRSYEGRMLLLPSGQVLWTGGSSDVEVYTPVGAPKAAWLPTITSAPSSVTRGQSYTITGTQFNGLSQGAMYGDDAQMATNYPLVAIRNRASHHIFFCRTHDHSTMGVATGSTPVSTTFDVPANMETGASDIVVGVNGTHSKLRPITVQ